MLDLRLFSKVKDGFRSARVTRELGVEAEYPRILERIGSGGAEVRRATIGVFAFVVRHQLRAWLERIPIVTAGEAFATPLGSSPQRPRAIDC